MIWRVTFPWAFFWFGRGRDTWQSNVKPLVGISGSPV